MQHPQTRDLELCSLPTTFAQIQNVALASLDAAETAAAIHREREFTRLQHVDLDELDLKTILVDPPRAGLDPDSLALTKEVNQRAKHLAPGGMRVGSRVELDYIRPWSD